MKTDHLIILIVGAVSALLADLSAHMVSKKDNPDATFNVMLSLKTIAYGVLVGAAGAGVSAVATGVSS